MALTLTNTQTVVQKTMGLLKRATTQNGEESSSALLELKIQAANLLNNEQFDDGITYANAALTAGAITPDELLDKTQLVVKAINRITDREFDKAVPFVNAALTANLITPAAFLDKLASYVLENIDKIKEKEDSFIKAENATKKFGDNFKQIDPRRLTFFEKFTPGIHIPTLKGQIEKEPSFAQSVVRENLQGVLFRNDPDFLPLFGKNPQEVLAAAKTKETYPFQVHMIHAHSGCCHDPHEH